MKKILCSLILFVAVNSCKETGTAPEISLPSIPSNALTASPSSVRLLPGGSRAVSISNSTIPDTIVIAPNSLVATASLNDTVLTIKAVALGSTSVRVADHSLPPKLVDIVITVATNAVAVILAGN